MNLEEMTKRFGLSSVEVKRIQSYMEKAEKSETKYCEDHDREFFDFEYGRKCPSCFQESLEWEIEDIEADKK
jgi:hypothetical protein